MKSPTLVFDLDGTLADTSRDLVPVLNRVTAKADLPPIAMAEVSKVVGHGAKAMIQRAFDHHGQPLSADQLDELFSHFLADYEENIADETVLFDGVLDSMDSLENDGWQFAVCTNKMQHLSEKLLKALGVEQRFKAIAGADRFDFRKPDPRHLTETIALANGSERAAIMIGDSKTDIDTAKAASIPVIAVDFGYTDIPVSELGPDKVISHFAELPAIIEEVRPF